MCVCVCVYLEPDNVCGDENSNTLHQVTQCVNKRCSNSQAAVRVLTPPLSMTPPLRMGMASRVGVRV